MDESESNMHRQIFIALAGSLFSLTFNTPCHAQTPPPFSPEIRLLLHGTKIFVPSSEDGKPGVGVSLWVIEPNLLDPTPQAQATAGLRLERPDGWVEFLGGGVFSPTTTSPIVPVFDLRAFVAPARHLHLFSEVSVYGDAIYGFAQADVPIQRGEQIVAKVGIEIEAAKAWEGPGGFVAVGPDVIIPWSEFFATVVAVQVRGTHSPTGPAADLVGRIYAVIDL